MARTTTIDPEALAERTVPELREIAREAGVEAVSNLRKRELITAIAEAGGGGGGPAAETKPTNGARLRAVDEKLAEVLGLARAARTATDTVAGLVSDERRRRALEEMGDQARETADRCQAVAARMGGRGPAIERAAGETADEAVAMMRTYLGDDADELDGFEFLVMAEMGEFNHWTVLRAMNETLRDDGIAELAAFAAPVQEEHLRRTVDACLAVARERDPTAPA